MRMTYKQLLEKLQKLPADRLNDTVTAWDYWESKFIPVCALVKAPDTDVLDYGHIVLELNN